MKSVTKISLFVFCFALVLSAFFVSPRPAEAASSNVSVYVDWKSVIPENSRLGVTTPNLVLASKIGLVLYHEGDGVTKTLTYSNLDSSGVYMIFKVSVSDILNNSWDVRLDTRFTIIPGGIYRFINNQAISGNASFYARNCGTACGSSSLPPDGITRISVAVVPPKPAAAPTCKLSASPTTIDQGKSSTLTFSSTNGTKWSISGIGSVAKSGTKKATPAITTRYTFSVEGNGGMKTCTTSVTVTGKMEFGTGTATITPASLDDSKCPVVNGVKSATYTTGILKGVPCVGAIDSLPEVLTIIKNVVMSFLLPIVGTLFIIMILIGGILYITSRGNKQQLERAKKILTAAIVGLLIVVLSYTLITIFVGVIGGNIS